MFNATDFSFFYCLLDFDSNISCLVLLIVNVSQIYWLSCQIFGISKQALDFVRDGKNVVSQMKILKKVSFFDNIPLLKMVQEVQHFGNL